MSCDVGLANTKLLIQQWFHLILPSDTVVIRVGVETLWYSHYDCFLMTHFWEHNPVWWHMALTSHIFYKCVSLICVYVHIFKLSQFLEVRDSRRSLLDGWFCFRISQDTVDDVSAETVPISVVDWPWSSFNMVPKQGWELRLAVGRRSLYFIMCAPPKGSSYVPVSWQIKTYKNIKWKQHQVI